MKKKKSNRLIFISLLLVMIISSCSRSGKEVFRVVPYNSTFVGTINPGQILKKADAENVEYIRDYIAGRPFYRGLIENPSSSGIETDAFSGVFMFGTDVKYLGVVLPIKKEKDFEKFLDQLGKENDAQFPRQKANGITYSKEGNNVLAWNKKLVLHLTCLSGTDSIPVEMEAARLFDLAAENCVLSDKDFNSFLGEQKDINLWVSSNQIGALTGKDLGILGMIGGLNNNYAHISLDFQDGAMVLTSNLLLNPDFKKNFDKFNFIDQNAQKDILKVLPGDNLIFAGNLKVNPSKILEIVKTINSFDKENSEKFLGEIGKSPEEIISAFNGSIAFSVNGRLANAPGGSDAPFKMPVISIAMQINNDQIFRDLLKLIGNYQPVESKNGYYLIRFKEAPVFAAVKNNFVILTNSESNISEILAAGELKNNLLDQEISSSLSSDPVCLYLNLDQDSYSKDMNDYLKQEMDQRMLMGIEGLGHALKSLTINGGIERSSLKIEMKDKSRNSLYIFLKSGEI